MYPVQFGDKGFGLVAGCFIPKETFIIQYIGEVLSLNSETGKKRLQEYSKSTCTYMMRLSSKEVIDPTYKGNMARFINHSCDPNCETRKWNVKGEIEVGIISIKDIQEGEELTFDYKFDVYQTPFTRCLCGTSKCKGYLGLVPLEYTLEEWEEKIDNLPCEICGSTSESTTNQLLLCDFCNNGFHMLCCDPQIYEIPQGAWFCKNCNTGIDPTAAVEKTADDDKQFVVKQAVTYDRPLKQMIMRDKKMTNQYLKMKRKGMSYVPDKNENDEDDPEYEFLKSYNAFFSFQKELQIDVIYEFLEEIKNAKKEAIRADKAKMSLEESTPDAKEEALEKAAEDEMIAEAEAADEDDEPSTMFEEDKKTSKQPAIPAPQTEARNAYEKIKADITEQFSKSFISSEVYKNLHDRGYLAQINKPGEIERKVMPISSVELTLFKNSDSLFKLVTQNLTAKLFWNNSQPYHPDVFAKTIEFNITGTQSQVALIRDIFKLMEDAVNWYKRISGFCTAVIRVPAIYLKRVVGEFQKNMYDLLM